MRGDGDIIHTRLVVEGNDLTLGQALLELAEHLLVPVVPEPHHLVHDALKAREYQAWSFTQFYSSGILPFKDQWERAKVFLYTIKVCVIFLRA